MSEFNVLISSAGRRVALLHIFRRTLQDLGLHGEVMAADMSRLSSAFHAADRAFVVPRCSDPEFLPTMLELCSRYRVRLVVPTVDPELPVYAANRERFSEIGTTVAISSHEAVTIGWDKAATHSWLTARGFPTVRQAPAHEVATPNGWSFPVLVKPRIGSASIGVAVVDDPIQLRKATRGGDFLVQAVAPGVEHTIDVLTDGAGKAVCAVPRRRIEVRAGEVSKGVTVRSAPLEELAFAVSNALPEAYAAITVQVFFDQETQEPRVIEINPRFGGGFPLSWQAGAAYPRWMIEEILGLPSTAAAASWNDGLVMLRYDDAVFVRAGDAGL
jgi:carbamoyl-phosphate synthase large subunit